MLIRTRTILWRLLMLHDRTDIMSLLSRVLGTKFCCIDFLPTWCRGFVWESCSPWPEIFKFQPAQHHPHVEAWLQQARLLELDSTLLLVINHDLISTFVERWQSETSSFHLPFGGMSVTLDDVFNLLHLPLTSTFRQPSDGFTDEMAVYAGFQLLGIQHDDCLGECRSNRGPYFRFGFLEEVYRGNLELGYFDHVARCYMLLLLGYIIFADNSHTYVPFKWVVLIQSFEECGQWGPVALAILYKQLNDTCFLKTNSVEDTRHCSNVGFSSIFPP